VALCQHPTCDLPARSAGWCQKHYTRIRRHGDPDHVRYPPLAQRLWAKVDRHGPDECWEWQGHRDRGGYGQITDGKKSRRVHQVAWETTRGPIPAGLHVLHSCDNPPCCNPAHLYLGDNAQNVGDRVARRRSANLRGTEHGRAMVTEKNVLAIRARYARGGTTYPELASIYGVSSQAIAAIVSRRTWRHLP
jgi:HNH endonuclease